MGALSLRNHAGPVEVCLSWSRKSDKASKPTVSVIMFTALSAAQFHSWNVRCVGLFYGRPKPPKFKFFKPTNLLMKSINHFALSIN